MTYKKLLLDVDGTLLDFDASAERSIEILFGQRGYPFDENVFPLYTEINNGLWEQYERGELSEGVRVHKMTISEVRDFSPAEVKKIRMIPQLL